MSLREAGIGASRAAKIGSILDQAVILHLENG